MEALGGRKRIEELKRENEEQPVAESASMLDAMFLTSHLIYYLCG